MKTVVAKEVFCFYINSTQGIARCLPVAEPIIIIDSFDWISGKAAPVITI